jgi:hypothetical protein
MQQAVENYSSAKEKKREATRTRLRSEFQRRSRATLGKPTEPDEPFPSCHEQPMWLGPDTVRFARKRQHHRDDRKNENGRESDQHDHGTNRAIRRTAKAFLETIGCSSSSRCP